jgi:hypothetical protein
VGLWLKNAAFITRSLTSPVELSLNRDQCDSP